MKFCFQLFTHKRKYKFVDDRYFLNKSIKILIVGKIKQFLGRVLSDSVGIRLCSHKSNIELAINWKLGFIMSH